MLSLCGVLWHARLVSNKRNSLPSTIVVLGALFGPISCSSDSGEATNDGGTPTTTGPTTTGTVTSTVGGTTTGGVSTTAASTSGSTTVATTASASTTGGTTGGTTTGSVTTASASTTDGTTTGTVTTTGAGGTSSTASMSSGAGGTTTTGTTGGGEDWEPTAEDFGCIADWNQVLRMRVNNFLGDAAASVAVAENQAGGVYPVGTVLQHFPTEAMVKRHAGFSPETKDWEFFLLTLNQDGSTTIAQRGTTDIEAMGTPCAECHARADEQWDFVCNTYVDASGSNCGFGPLGQQQLDQQIANDPRCD